VANKLYDHGRNSFSNGDTDWTNDKIVALLIDTDDYTVDLANDQFLSVIPTAARVSITTLQGKSAVAGVHDANDATFPSVTGDQCEAIILAKDTGDENTSILIAYIDDAGNLPATPNGRDIAVQWSDGADKIFKL
jgi:hypothetical protein